MKKKNLRLKILFLIFVILVSACFGVIGYLYLYKPEAPSSDVAITNPVSLIPQGTDSSLDTQTSQVDFPFSEMTIPSLRARSYESSLSELKKIGENSNFTTYLTSYDSDGYSVNGLLTIPSGNPPSGGFPAVVFVHGYIPPAQYKTESNYVSYANALSDDGLVVFKIDLRGHAGSEGEAHGAYYSEQYVVDVLNAHAALKSTDFVNPEKIGLWGHSMGGNVVFRSFAVSGEIRKVVIWAGAVYTYEDFGEYQISDGSYRPPTGQSESRQRRERLFDTYGSFDPNNEFWKQVPATNYLDDVSGSVQIHHAIDDNVVGINYSRNLINILDRTTIKHELFEYSSGGHNLTGNSFNQAMRRSADFLAN